MSKHLSKKFFVSPTNSSLVGLLITIGLVLALYAVIGPCLSPAGASRGN